MSYWPSCATPMPGTTIYPFPHSSSMTTHPLWYTMVSGTGPVPSSQGNGCPESVSVTEVKTAVLSHCHSSACCERQAYTQRAEGLGRPSGLGE